MKMANIKESDWKPIKYYVYGKRGYLGKVKFAKAIKDKADIRIKKSEK